MLTARNVAETGIAPPVELSHGDYVLISIQDSGSGIPEEHLARIFDPYFTTKEHGSGLGLATSYPIARNHGGMIDVATKQGSGSTLNIYLPARRDAARVAPAASPAT